MRGSIRVRLGSGITILTAPADGKGVEVKVERGLRHEWSRASLEGKDVVVVERTDLEDGLKSVFFWQLNGVILAADREEEDEGWLQMLVGGSWIPLQLFMIFRMLDNWPVFVDLGAWGMLGRWTEGVFTHTVLGVAGVLGWVGGVMAVRRERMPEGLWERASERKDIQGAK